jgi:putative ABC transport system ATP-binding protein
MSHAYHLPMQPSSDISKSGVSAHGTSGDGSPVILLENLRLTLDSTAGPVQVLGGVDLAVHQGESVAVVGPSGAGKTSTLMLMAGLEKPSSGTVRVAGHDLAAMDEDQLAAFRRKHVGVVFQAFHLVPTMTALENVALPLEFAHADDPRGRARAALASVGLEARAGHYPSQLSGGEQQRVAIARAVAPGPAILLADEPTGNLDEDTGERIMRLLFSLRTELGSTLVLVTHDQDLAGRCDRILTMHDGRLAEKQAAGAGA